MQLRPILALAALSVVATDARAQITSIGPFTGMAAESFEGQPQQQFNPCLPYRVFNNQGDLCTPNGANAHTTPSWSFMCQIFPHTGNLLYGSTGGPSVITLDSPTNRFGGYFGSISGAADGVVRLYDPSGGLIGSRVVTAPANCTWTWNGWHSVTPVKRVEFDGNYPFGGGYLMADSLEVDVLPTPIVYCTAKVNSLGCLPSIGFIGLPAFGVCTGFDVTCANVRNNKSGLLFFGNSGQAALPFQGGTLCVKSPIHRTPAMSSMGNPPPANDCSGLFQINMAAFMCSAPMLFVPGMTVDVQWWGRDPGFPAPNNTMLSNGLEYTI